MSVDCSSEGSKKSGLPAKSYQDYVEARCIRNPSLLNLKTFLADPNTRDSGCRLVALDFLEGHDGPVVREDITLDGLSSENRRWKGEEPTNEHSPLHQLQGRILIVEDLTKHAVQILGAELEVDPFFLAFHLHVALRRNSRLQVPDEVTLPSLLENQDYINLAYHRSTMMSTKNATKSRFLRDTVVQRKVVLLPSTNIGLSQHCTSLLRKKLRNGLWIGTLIPSYLYTFCFLS
jgi:hypothetical protein